MQHPRLLDRKSILITGGAGFLGSHLCDRLIDAGHDVICLDNFFPGHKRKLWHLIGRPRFELLRHDVTFPLYIEVDEIYNLACPASPIHYQHDPVQTTKTSVHGAINMLGLAKRLKCRILQASTSEVYGDPTVHPQKEDYWGNVNTIGPRSCYDAETEILTENGWVPFPQLGMGVKVATRSEDGRVEYHVPDEIISQPYVGEMLRFADAKYDFTVTPNHMMAVLSKTGKQRFLRADEDRYWPAWAAFTSAAWCGEEREWMDLGPPPRNAKTPLDRVRMDDWLEFLGYYISEGCVHVRGRVREVEGASYEVADYNILLAQEDPYGRRKMTECLDRLGWNYFDSDDHQFRICSSHLATHLLSLGKSGDKYIPRQYLELSPRQSRILLDALILGDGTVNGDAYCYYTKSRQLASDVQELALRCGFAATFNLTPGRDLYRVNIRRGVPANLTSPDRRMYSGNVHCVSVCNHVICVRRSGRAAWCGNCYDEGKRCAETLFFDYYRQHKLDIKVARIFNTYGPRMHPNDGRVVSNFIVQALKGKPITIYGDGSQTRSFCYVDDLVEGLLRLMSAPAETTGPINLGNPAEFTIKQLAELAIEMTGSKSTLTYLALPQDDPKQRQPDITLARERLKWQPTMPLREGLAKTIGYFDRLLSGQPN